MTSSNIPSERSLQERWLAREVPFAVLKAQALNGSVRRVTRELRERVLDGVVAELVRRLPNISQGTSFLDSARSAHLFTAVRRIVREGGRHAERALLGELSSLVDLELDHLAFLGRELVGVDFDLVPARSAMAMVKKAPMLGRTIAQWFQRWVPQSIEGEVERVVRAGMVAGDDPRSIVAGLKRGALMRAEAGAKTLTITASTHASNTARDQLYRANADIVPKVRWVSTLDLRTSKICAALDGEEWKTTEPHPNPPKHMSCRSIIVPVVGPRVGKRAALGGRVDAKTDFGDWLEDRSAAEQDLVLGKTVGQAWRAGKLSLDEMVDATYSRVLTIDELRRLGRL